MRYQGVSSLFHSFVDVRDIEREETFCFSAQKDQVCFLSQLAPLPTDTPFLSAAPLIFSLLIKSSAMYVLARLYLQDLPFPLLHSSFILSLGAE